jgi:DNA processing protein
MKTIGIDNSEYPALLKQVSGPPRKLYYRGSWDQRLFDNCLAVVGSRKMTVYGRQMTDRLVGEIASRGVTIVSGFMYGIDAQAHKAAVSAGGKTIAVMPCGIDRIHPHYQKELYQQIISAGGLIISQWPGDSQPSFWTYPKRNRIVAGLSAATLVIEAGLKSGSLITASLARKFGRGLFAVPGPVTSSVSQGSLQLIKQGAEMVTGAGDILAFFGLADSGVSRDRPLPAGLSRLEQAIIDELSREPKKIDDLSRALSISAARLGASLSCLQLRGAISEEEGKFYVNSAGSNRK